MLSLFEKKENNFLKNSSSFYYSKNRNSRIADGWVDFKGKEVEYELILPKTFMNNSGDAFKGVLSKKEKERVKEVEKIIVIHDDIALPFGEVRVSFGRGDGGHNGIKDLIKKLGSKKFIRIRVGVCPLDFFGRCRKPKKEAMNKYLTARK